MDLKEFLKEAFPTKEEKQYFKMIEDLENLSINKVSDLEDLREESLKGVKNFSQIEIKKLLRLATNPG